MLLFPRALVKASRGCLYVTNAWQFVKSPFEKSVYFIKTSCNCLSICLDSLCGPRKWTIDASGHMEVNSSTTVQPRAKDRESR
jgi:hypothetical protein